MSFPTGLKLPSEITVCEVAPRDGFQAENQWIPTEKKVAIVRKLADTGIKSIELTSFVHPKAIPQLKDAEEVVKACLDLEEKGIQFRALVPNEKGAQRAIDAGIKKIKLMLSATDSHSLSNANSTTKEAIDGFAPIIELAEKHQVKVGGSISVAFGCPFEHKVPIHRLKKIIERYTEYGVYEISLADSAGMGNPKSVYETVGELRNVFPDVTFTMHLHNTRDMAVANAFAGMLQGITGFDSSIAALGGCPYIPNASGNLSTEDFVHAVHEAGVKTGIDLDKLIQVAKDVKGIIGYDGGSYMMKAGPNYELHAKPKKQEKLG
ncbi:hydroxymethylglutaryl-CoA lyase [Bacilli bacterium]|uniref:hydroxymethylglutaryl-CoA lyase n=1 Tax=Oceanobacillus caeni TaxID=405946 RepID=UPI00062134D3|nr:hydroxymethylglutaryl-CoA lyase [Oceanobacillus caeni]KKE79631.1 hydroxymethylglutaryl-CoA lyase [Bacilli bacterium VT-13-104]PZD89655.1 hydroxymethylglutaryl-CoA lyase [Bacilli bacterium]MBU8790264.1 hydroxymethylglutaryl-CoA lyase [Oceanobacillus caeni]PZD91177.1 hydroxymethylglutaryl-CoA lyase [Bacilli bacterium]PZD92724.1 hydroxymethylglutaryl-CoA lyase [Bacilli bacterium]